MSTGLWAPLDAPDDRRRWLGQTVSVIGDKIDQIALGILVFEVTGSGLQMGIMLAISMLPAALFGMLAGAYVDRWDRRRTMIVADVVRAGLVLSVPFAIDVGLWLVYLIALAVATVSLFFEPAKLSLIPDLVGSERLMAANSLDSVSSSASELLGLAFAGGLVAAMGYRVAFFIDAATYLLSAVFILTIAYRTQRPGPRGASWRDVLRDATAGVRYIAHEPVLRDLLVVYAAAMTGVAASVMFIYVLALDRFSAGAPGLASLDAAITVGLLVGSFAVARSELSRASRTLLVGLLVFAALFVIVAFAPSLVSLIPLFFLLGIANMYFYVPMAAIVQSVAAPEMRGRALAAKQVLSRALSVVGFVGAGFLVEQLGITESILIFSGIVAAAALVGFTRPHLRVA
ncbi:MAG: MFS transporter [Coriobacteriia bacterium]|nr:MFS transporter [Coriobacteriia bacterium]